MECQYGCHGFKYMFFVWGEWRWGWKDEKLYPLLSVGREECQWWTDNDTQCLHFQLKWQVSLVNVDCYLLTRIAKTFSQNREKCIHWQMLCFWCVICFCVWVCKLSCRFTVKWKHPTKFKTTKACKTYCHRWYHLTVFAGILNFFNYVLPKDWIFQI